MKHLSLLTTLLLTSSMVYAGDWTYHDFNPDTKVYNSVPKYSCLEMICEYGCVENDDGQGECCPAPVEGDNCIEDTFDEHNCPKKKKICPPEQVCNNVTGLCESCPKGSSQYGKGGKTPVPGCFCNYRYSSWWDLNSEVDKVYRKAVNEQDGLCRECAHVNLVDYKPYIHEGCVDNSDCNSNQFCRILKTNTVNLVEEVFNGEKVHAVDICMSKKLKGVCEDLDKGSSVEIMDSTRKVLTSDRYMNWWSASNWCKAHKKELVDAFSLKYDNKRVGIAIPQVYEHEFNRGLYWTSTTTIHGSAAKVFGVHDNSKLYWQDHSLTNDGAGYAGRAVCE